MDYIREAENILKEHRKLESALDNLKIRKSRLIMSGPKDIRAIDYSTMPGSKRVYGVVNNLCELADVGKQIQETEDQIEFIKEILEEIKTEDETSEKYLRLRYFEKYKASMADLAEEFNYSENSKQTMYRIKNKALKEFVVRYFGVVGLKSI